MKSRASVRSTQSCFLPGLFVLGLFVLGLFLWSVSAMGQLRPADLPLPVPLPAPMEQSRGTGAAFSTCQAQGGAGEPLPTEQAQPAEQSSIPQGPHGGTLEAFQESQLTKLQQKDETQTAFSGIDPKVLQAFLSEPDNTPTAARIRLGRRLYFDARLSADGTVSCATCHDVQRGFCDQRPVSEGVRGQLGQRNAPTVMNIGLLRSMFWDGRSPSLEHQALRPIVNPLEMGMEPDGKALLARLQEDPQYEALFQEAYGHSVNLADVGRALAVFERTLVFMDAPGLRYLRGDENAISEDAKQGWGLFNGKGRCVTCHTMSVSQPTGTDNRFHNIGVGVEGRDFDHLAREVQALWAQGGVNQPSTEKLDELARDARYNELGRALVTDREAARGAFRTPVLLNVGITWPYMHDGSLRTLWDVMDHYNKGGEANRYLDGGIEPLNLTDEEIDQLVAFLFTLTDDRFQEQNRQVFERMATLARQRREHRDEPVASRRVLQYERAISPALKKETNGNAVEGGTQ